MPKILCLVLAFYVSGCGARRVELVGPLAQGFYALNANTVLYSPDGDAWQPVFVADHALLALASSRDRLVAVGLDGQIVVSADGKNFRSIIVADGRDLFDVAYDGDRFIAVGYSWEQAGVILTSTSGDSWQLLKEVHSHPYQVGCVHASCILTAGHNGDLPYVYYSLIRGQDMESIDYDQYDYVFPAQEIRKALSVPTQAPIVFKDGEVIPVTPLDGPKPKYLALDGRYVAVAHHGRLYQSDDAATWNALPDTAYIKPGHLVRAAAGAGKVIVGNGDGDMIVADINGGVLTTVQANLEPYVTDVHYVGDAPVGSN